MSMMKTCIGTDTAPCPTSEVVSARRRRCPDCRSRQHALAKREARAAESGDRWDNHAEHDEEPVDTTYAQLGGANKPPEFDLHVYAPRRPAGPPPVDDRYAHGGGGYQGPQPYVPDETGIPASIRQNREQSLRMAAAMQQRADREQLGTEPETWSASLQSIQAAFDGKTRFVEFQPPPQVTPSGYDWLGRPYRKQRGGLR